MSIHTGFQRQPRGERCGVASDYLSLFIAALASSSVAGIAAVALLWTLKKA
jgi:hypothetical protein